VLRLPRLFQKRIDAKPLPRMFSKIVVAPRMDEEVEKII